jgi:hypothetical protein
VISVIVSFIRGKETSKKMLHIQRIPSVCIASAVLCCFASAIRGAAPNVTYVASGTFATPAVSGEDTFKFAGEPFTLTFVVNEATKPIRHSETMAEYSNIPVKVTVTTGTNGATYMVNATARLSLVVGAPGKPDRFAVRFPLNFGGLPLMITAKARMPAGTISRPAIKPFTAPITLTPKDGMAIYACPDCSAPWTGHSTTLATAGGTLTATREERQ